MVGGGLALSLAVACSGGDDVTTPVGAGASAGRVGSSGGTPAGGASAGGNDSGDGGATMMSGGAGGASDGGASNGGAPLGGAGGADDGGMSSGGMAAGGMAAGGMAAGGMGGLAGMGAGGRGTAGAAGTAGSAGAGGSGRLPCPAGYEPESSGGGGNGRVAPPEGCVPCTGGTWSPGNDAVCQSWSECSAGFEPSNTPTATQDRTCSACPSGTASEGGTDACEVWSDCSPGEYEDSAPSGTDDRQCRGCAYGTFSTTTNAGSCTAWTDCAGAVVDEPGTTTTDRVCCSATTVGDACTYSIAAFSLVYDLTLPFNGDWNTVSDVPYGVDNSGDAGGIGRVAYLLELNEEHVWVEMDDFTGGMKDRLGVPVDWVYDQSVNDLTVRSNSSNVVEVTNDGTGKIEFWHFNYSPGADNTFDSDDDIGPTADGFGSMQVHRGTRTELAFNRWSVSSTNDLGIGPRAANPFDYTNATNAGQFVYRRLRVFVRPPSGTQ